MAREGCSNLLPASLILLLVESLATRLTCKALLKGILNGKYEEKRNEQAC